MSRRFVAVCGPFFSDEGLATAYATKLLTSYGMKGRQVQNNGASPIMDRFVERTINDGVGK
jgi:hypothetical protein